MAWLKNLSSKKVSRTQEFTELLEEIFDRIEESFNPISIFLYGSRARSDAIEGSDYELGILLPKKHNTSNESVREVVNCTTVSAYSFKFEDFLENNIDTPFNKNLFMFELSKYGKTVRGRRIVEALKPPRVSALDLYSEAQFNLGYALGAVIAYRNDSISTAVALFYKSCLFGTRALIAARKGKFVASYPDILDWSKSIELGEYGTLIDAAFEARLTGQCDFAVLVENISYLNQVVLPSISSLIVLGDGVKWVQLH